jgi:predicted AlkP superfamily phosphohydrolase/phosphomutase
MATGKVARKHGIKGFVKPGADGASHLYQSGDREVQALWNILSLRGVRVGVVNWWTTYPPEAVNGVIVSDLFFSSSFQGRGTPAAGVTDRSSSPLVHPVSFEPRARELLSDEAPLTRVANPFDDSAFSSWVKRDLLSKQFRMDGAATRIALAVQEEFRPDVLLVVLYGIDRASHWLWGSLEPESLYPEALRPTPSARAAGIAALERSYEYVDAMIGLLVAGMGSDDLVLVVSDHGFESAVVLDRGVTGHHQSEAGRDGVVFARGRGIPAGGGPEGMTINDVTPTLLAWLGLPVAEDMDGVVAPFLELPTLERIASYEAAPRPVSEARPSEGEAELVERLRALGYDVDPPGTPEE